MKIEIHLFGKYRKYFNKTSFTKEFGENITPLGVAQSLGIPATPSLWFLLNDAPTDGNEILKDGDTLCIFEPVGGG